MNPTVILHSISFQFHLPFTTTPVRWGNVKPHRTAKPPEKTAMPVHNITQNPAITEVLPSHQPRTRRTPVNAGNLNWRIDMSFWKMAPRIIATLAICTTATTFVQARESREDPALAHAVMNQSIIDLIYWSGDMRAAQAPQLVEFYPLLGASN